MDYSVVAIRSPLADERNKSFSLLRVDSEESVCDLL